VIVRVPVIVKKTIADLLQPRWLGAYLVGYVSVAWFWAVALGNNEITDNVAELPLAEQELQLLSSYVTVSWIWVAGLPILVIGAVFAANSLAREAETGTLQMLLSRPIRRREVLVGVFIGNVVSLLLVGIASMLLIAVLLYQQAGTAAAALNGGVFAILPENILLSCFVSVLVAAVGVAFSVLTENRLQTVLGGLSLSVSFFTLWLVRLINRSLYEEYYLYVLDVSYHLGNVYALLHANVGEELPTQTKLVFGTLSGIYDLEGIESSGPPESIELVGYVDPVVSLVGLLTIAIGSLALAIYRFERLDI
jgi:ABC-2 type transport system permease protein